jgi:hypothetical protein
MPINFRISALVPVGLIVESVAQLDDSILVAARAGIQVASCPLCGSRQKAPERNAQKMPIKTRRSSTLGDDARPLGVGGLPTYSLTLSCYPGRRLGA